MEPLPHGGRAIPLPPLHHTQLHHQQLVPERVAGAASSISSAAGDEPLHLRPVLDAVLRRRRLREGGGVRPPLRLPRRLHQPPQRLLLPLLPAVLAGDGLLRAGDHHTQRLVAGVGSAGAGVVHHHQVRRRWPAAGVGRQQEGAPPGGFFLLALGSGNVVIVALRSQTQGQPYHRYPLP